MLRRLIATVLVISVIGIVSNDIVRYGVARKDLRQTTFDLSSWASQNVRSLPRAQAASLVAERAATSGVTVWQYGQDDNAIQIWTRSEVKGTVVARTLLNMVMGKSFGEARRLPLTIDDYQESRFL